ncbi:MAG TPA: N-acetyltransferase [Pyrinomonadaceae bacterium]
MLTVRAEAPEDRESVRRVNEAAFGRAGEADLVEALRAGGRHSVSLVAEEAGRVVGHILFSPLTVESGAGEWVAQGLGPMAVVPGRQRRGVGSLLVREGLRSCARLGHEVVFVLGHADYYPRFGFRAAAREGLACEFPAPEECFMVAELRPGALAGRKGLVRYAPEFKNV